MSLVIYLIGASVLFLVSAFVVRIRDRYLDEPDQFLICFSIIFWPIMIPCYILFAFGWVLMLFHKKVGDVMYKATEYVRNWYEFKKLTHRE